MCSKFQVSFKSLKKKKMCVVLSSRHCTHKQNRLTPKYCPGPAEVGAGQRFILKMSIDTPWKLEWSSSRCPQRSLCPRCSTQKAVGSKPNKMAQTSLKRRLLGPHVAFSHFTTHYLHLPQTSWSQSINCRPHFLWTAIFLTVKNGHENTFLACQFNRQTLVSGTASG